MRGLFKDHIDSVIDSRISNTWVKLSCFHNEPLTYLSNFKGPVQVYRPVNSQYLVYLSGVSNIETRLALKVYQNRYLIGIRTMFNSLVGLIVANFG